VLAERVKRPERVAAAGLASSTPAPAPVSPRISSRRSSSRSRVTPRT